MPDDDPNLARWNATLRGPVVSYKASRVKGVRATKAELAAPACLCCYPLRVAGQEVPMRHGVTIALCVDHRDPAFLTSRGGRDFLASLGEVYRSLGLTGTRWRKAAQALVADAIAMGAPTPRARPGSYAWPHLRAAAEHAWAGGADFHRGEAVVLDLHQPYADAVRPPSRQTVRRWWRERRWLTPRPAPPRPAPTPIELSDRRPVHDLQRSERHPALAGRRRGPASPPEPPAG